MWEEYNMQLWMLSEIKIINPADELSKFITEILLTKRNSKYIELGEQYLIEIKNISFEIHSNDIDESCKQINYINYILQKCLSGKFVRIDLHKISIDELIDLHFLSLKHDIELDIWKAEFTDNDSNMICINGYLKLTTLQIS